jgi:hypothetical protein
MERLQKLADARSLLLKVERQGGGAGGPAPGFLLTFEAGRLLIRVEVASGEVHSIHLESSEGLPEGLGDAGEDEPWWRLIGCPITRVWTADPSSAVGGLRLQFREDDQHPRIVGLAPDGEAVRAWLDPAA